MLKWVRELLSSGHLIIKVPLDVELLELGRGEAEAAAEVHVLLPPVLQHPGARHADIRDTAHTAP